MFDRMTPRERQILTFITNGVCNKDIARRIALSTHTVKSHVRNIMEKLGLHSRLELAAEANAERWRAYDERQDGAESAMRGQIMPEYS
jgi:DNA-binding NarL/FixJ family response regulator